MPFSFSAYTIPSVVVATVLTVYGIETEFKIGDEISLCGVATVLTVYGIETK